MEPGVHRMDIDDVDFSILNVIASHGAPMWKKKIHRNLPEGGLPNVQDISVQTVGRRVDDLHDRGYLESCIISPREINRDLIIAFKVTGDGHEVRTAKRSRLLRDHASRLVSGGTDGGGDVATIARLMEDELDLDPETTERLHGCDPDHLLTLLLLHYTRDAVEQRIDTDQVDQLADLAATDDRLASILRDGGIPREHRDSIDDDVSGA